MRQLGDLRRPRRSLALLRVWIPQIPPRHELLGGCPLSQVLEAVAGQRPQPARSELCCQLPRALPERRDRPKLQRVLVVIGPASAPWAGHSPGAVTAAACHTVFA